ncbi:hypothetical protein GQ44DRAFT_636213 [Phaeosphaeriaceae sp. PMI808]|nr:hypothetical protein GQ44DRAFT_636213 [Phaeosphaeriaceae sp. PMI808]
MGAKISKVVKSKHASSTTDEDHVPLLSDAAPPPVSLPFGLQAPTLPSNNQSVDLEIYMRFAMMQIQYEAPEHFFRRTNDFPTPRLQKDVINRILVFKGTFNPPHMGHKTLLTHAFLRSAHENAIAALILPCQEWLVEEKYQDDKSTMIFSEQQPADGYKIELITVMGVDYLEYAMGHQYGGRADRSHNLSFVFSDANRWIERTPLGPPHRHEAYTKWYRNEEGDEKLLQNIEMGIYSGSHVLHLLFPRESGNIAHKLEVSPEDDSDALAALRTCLHESGGSWVSRKLTNMKLKIRFVPARKVLDADDDAVIEISATDIREIIRGTPDCLLASRLKGIALNPELLAEFVKENRKTR